MQQSATQRLFSLGGLPLFLTIFWLSLLGGAVILTERPTGSISGLVTTFKGKTPLAGARIVLSGPVRKVGRTRADGTFRLDRVPVGNYQVQAARRGYDSQWAQGTLAIEEGRITENVNFSLMQRDPELNLGSPQRVFLPGETVRINARGVLFNKFDLELQSVNLGDYLKTSDSLDRFDEWVQSPDKSSFKGSSELMARWSAAVLEQFVDEDDGWFYQPIEIPARSPGTYLLTARGVSETGLRRVARLWFTVSRIGLITKHAAGEMLVYAVDLTGNTPRPGVRIHAFGQTGTLAQGNTDAHGLWRFREMKPGSTLVYGRDGDSPALVSSYFSTERDRFSVYSYTERPVYRPGQTVYFKGIMRLRGANSYRVPGGQDVQVEIVDSRDQVVAVQSLSVNSFGTYHGQVQLGDHAPLGEYTLRTNIGAESHSTSFKVLEYRKPEYKLEISSTKKYFLQGEPIQASVRASYYFGSPAAGIKVHYTVYAAPHYSYRSEEDDFFYGYGDDAYEYWGYGDVVQEGEGTTDPQGLLALSIPTRRGTGGEDGRHAATYDQQYTLEVEATDISRRPVTERFRVLVTQGAFRIRLSTSQYLYAAGDPIQLTIEATDYDGKPVPDTPIALVISREEQVRGRSEEAPFTYKYYRFLTQMVKTDKQGKATWTGQAPGDGYLDFQAQARDGLGNTLTADHWTWVTSAKFAWDGAEPLVNLVFDKKSYRPGEVAKVLITSPVKDVTALITIEGGEIYQAQVLPMPTFARMIRLPVLPEYAPNVHVAVSITRGKTHYQRTRSLNVSPRAHFLNLSVRSDKPRYGPGQRVRYLLQANDERGKPVQAEVSLGVVDAAIYAIAPEETPDIQRFFWGPRANEVHTNYSFAEEYSGGGDKELGKERIRRNFKDTAAWFPSVVTGQDGQAEVWVSLPDNLTTWIATARGVTPETAVGGAGQSIVSTKDLLVRLVTPRFFVQNDRLSLSTIVHNNTNREQPVTVRLQARGLALESPGDWKTSVPAAGLQGRDWPVKVTHDGPQVLTAYARAPSLSDAMEMTIPALPHGIPQFFPFSGAVADNAETLFQFNLPPTALPNTWFLQINLSPTPASAIVGALSYLNGYPYGCVEQTMDTFLPAAVALQALRQLGLSQPALEKLLPLQLQAGLDNLSTMQHGDGGWGWWKNDDSQPYLSAYVLYGLSLAQQARMPIPPAMIRTTKRFLQRAVSDLDRDVYFRHWVEHGGGPETRAYALHALSYQDGVEMKEMDRLWPERQKLSNYALALFALTLANTGRHDAALTVLGELGERAVMKEDRTYWKSRSLRYSWLDSDIEASAYALKTYLRLTPTDPRIEGIMHWLLAQRQGDRWTSTKDSAIAILALADYLQTRVIDRIPEYTARVLINDREVGSFAINRGTMFDPDRTVRLKGSPLIVGENRVRIVKEGYGPLEHSAALSYTDAREDIPPESAHGLKIQRTYYLFSPTLRARKGDYAFSDFYRPEILKDLAPLNGRVRSGEFVLVHLAVEAEEKYQYLILEDPLPAGAEVVEDKEDRWRYWWAHREVHDERVAFFFTRLEKGPHHIFYLLRPLLPGHYHILPTRVYGMYAPEVRGHSAEARLEIQP